MTAIGEQLRKAREQKNLNLDQVADETNIAKRYLTALEEENFTVFPGDPYAIGFIRNYADYLGLKGEEFVNAYKGMRIQEQPVPIEELIPKNTHRLSTSGLVALVALGLIVAGGVALFAIFGGAGAGEGLADATRTPTDYPFSGASFERRLYPGDAILLSYANEEYRLTLESIKETVAIGTPLGPIQFMMAEESTIDLDKNNRPELRVYVSDFQKNAPEKGTLVRFDLINGSEIAAASSDTSIAPEAVETTVAANKVIFENPATAYPFGLQIAFRGPVLFRYEIDKKERKERYYGRNDPPLYIKADNGIKLWCSNAANIELSAVAGGKKVDLNLGVLGEVAVKWIKWIKTDVGSWQLAIFDVD